MPFPSRRDFRGLELRRKQAARLFAAGKIILSSIARELKVSRQSVTRWYKEWKRGGVSALRGAGRAGRKPKLDPRRLQQVDKALRQGARAHGFDTDLWTLPRVARVIERLTGVRYHPGHVWFHHSEGYKYFYHLGLLGPIGENADRARSFACAISMPTGCGPGSPKTSPRWWRESSPHA